MDHSVALMIGLPGQGMHLRVDALSALFLCILAPQTLAAAIAGMARSVTFWVLVLAMVLTVLAADAFSLILGFELMSAASWLLVLQADQRPATLQAGVGLFAAACLIPAVFLPAGGLAFVLILLAGGATAGLAPLHAWLPRALPAPPAAVAAIMSGGMVKVALYMIIRYAFIVFGAAQQPWWGMLLILAGAASVLIGGLRTMLEVELKTLLASSTVAHVGLIAAGLGIALRAKALDDPALAALALQAALLCMVAHALFKPLLFLGAGAVKHATGTTSLDWLGGLLRAMPKLGVLMLAGGACMAALPLGAGFAPEFLLLHAVIAAAAVSGILARIGFTALLTVLGLAAALGLGAAVRLIGTGFLGRPRSLRAAAAEEADRRSLAGMALLALCAVPVALTPGLILMLMRPIITLLVPNAVPSPLGYAPLPLALLMALVAAAAVLLLRRFAVRGEREVQPWNGGFGRPPVWLPFGDPQTQPSASGFAEPVERMPAGAMLSRAGAGPGEFRHLASLSHAFRRVPRLAARIGRASIRQRLAFALVALVLFLLALGLGQSG